MITVGDIERARARIEGRVRRTPVMAAAPMGRDVAPGARLMLKLECLQVTGSFKPRGACSRMFALPEAERRRGVVAASGGNHGLGVAWAAALTGAPATIYLPRSTPDDKVAKLEASGAVVIIEGAVFDDANRAALARAEADGLHYFHPFADPDVIAGQGTLGLEIMEDVPETDLLLVAIGGGGLLAGVATAVRGIKPDMRIVGIEPEGAPTLQRSVAAGEPVTLEAIETKAGSLAPRRSAAINVEIIGRTVDEIVLVSDGEMREAARWLWSEMGVAAELGGAAAIAALMSGRVAATAGATVTAIICGAGRDGMD